MVTGGKVGREIRIDIYILLYTKLISNKDLLGASQVALVVKNPLANAEDGGDTSSIPGSGRFPGGVATHSSICLENPMDRGAWWATVHRVTKSRTQLKRLSTQHTRTYCIAEVTT